jgi:argininosuccinate synthase
MSERVAGHRALEAVTADRDTARSTRTAERRWGELAPDEPWSSPLENALDAFLETTREQVSGEGRPLPDGGRAVAEGPRGEVPPPYSTRAEGDTVDQLWDLPSKRDLNK